MAIGLQRKTVRVVGYDSTWPTLYQSEASLIRARLGFEVCNVAHIGSTAVPGLEAKPIIDIMLGVRSLRVPEALFAALSELGYEHRPYDDISDRLFFAKAVGALRTHNLS
ncbi:MAG TPA: GrpB family protein, partial [Polyangiaceae bacterium]|nr:GrpB family protein [Polyangiaceae bacterium]